MSEPVRYKLRLFITGQTPRSTRAIENMHRICEENLKGQYDVEIVDVYQDVVLRRVKRRWEHAIVTEGTGFA